MKVLFNPLAMQFQLAEDQASEIRITDAREIFESQTVEGALQELAWGTALRVTDAPNNDTLYGRKNGAWTAVTAGGVLGTGAPDQISIWSGTNTLTGSSNFVWDETTRALTIGGSGNSRIQGVAGRSLVVSGGDNTNPSLQGGFLVVGGGDAIGDEDTQEIRGGDTQITAGKSVGHETGSDTLISAGKGGDYGAGGAITISSGAAGSLSSNGETSGNMYFNIPYAPSASINGKHIFRISPSFSPISASFDFYGLTDDRGYAFPDVSGTLALGAGTLTASTTNDVTVAGHTHAITPSLGLLSSADAQYKVLISGATPFTPAYSGFLLDGNAGGKTIFNVTSGKTVTVNATDNSSITFTGASNLTIPTAGSVTAALLGTANTFSALNVFNGNAGLAEDDYIGYPGVEGASYMPTESGGYNSVLNTLYSMFLNLDSGAAGANQGFEIWKGRTRVTGGTRIFRFGTDGNVALYLENSFFGYPGSTAQGFTPFTSSYNFIYNSLFNHVWNIDSGNGSTTQKFIWGHNGTSETPTEIASLTEAGLFTLMDGGNFAFGTTTGTKIGTATSQKIGFWNKTPVVQPAAYTPTNVSTDRSYDANATSIDELADVLGTLIADLQSIGLIG